MKKTPSILRFEVTQADLDIARRGDHSGCAVEAALARTFPQLQRISVSHIRIRASEPLAGLKYRWVTPQHVDRWIELFDNPDRTWDMGPLKIVLRKDDATIEQITVSTAAERAVKRERAQQRKTALAFMPVSQRKLKLTADNARHAQVRRLGA